MRILLIMPRWAKKIGYHYDFPLGIAYISAVLKKQNFDVTCLNLNLTDTDLPILLRYYIEKQGIRIVCTGGGVTDYQQIKKIVGTVKNLDRNVTTIVGGALISCDPELMLRSIPMDFGVIGEGEITIVELIEAIMNKKDPDNISGIAYLNGHGNFIKTAPRAVIESLDSIPFPDYDGFNANFHLSLQRPFDMYHLYISDIPRYLPMISSRSCPFSCTFCYHPLGSKYRSRSLDNFFDELSLLVNKYNLNTLVIYDDLFAANREKTLEFCARMKPYRLHWIPQMRVNNVDNTLLEALKDAGCFCISYGIESANDHILESMNKKITVAQIEAALALTYQHKIGIQGNLIFGDPAETEETARQSLQWWLNNLKYEINLSICLPFPGSPIYLEAVRSGRIPDKLQYIEEGCPIVNISKMSDKQFNRFTQDVKTTRRTHRNYAAVLSCTLVTQDVYKGPLFKLTLRCPHCGSTVTYNNVNSYINWYSYDRSAYKLACRECNQRFDLSSKAFGKNIFGLPRYRSWDIKTISRAINDRLRLRSRIKTGINKIFPHSAG